MDHLSSSERSRQMALMKSKNTAPELAVRKIVYGMGFRYRLHEKGLPGKPDIVFKGRKKVIFVHGCFWHRHEGCRRASNPKSNLDYWSAKFNRNTTRDRANLQALHDAGWETLIVWECELKSVDALATKLRAFISSPNHPLSSVGSAHQNSSVVSR
jgi:DNA mismatch endonuclease (patch repair protein)